MNTMFSIVVMHLSVKAYEGGKIKKFSFELICVKYLLNPWFVDHYMNLFHTLMNSFSSVPERFLNLSVPIWLFLVLYREIRCTSQLNIWSVKVNHLLNLNSGSVTDSLLGRGNYYMNLSLWHGVNPLNSLDTQEFGGRGCNSLVHKWCGYLSECLFNNMLFFIKAC